MLVWPYQCCGLGKVTDEIITLGKQFFINRGGGQFAHDTCLNAAKIKITYKCGNTPAPIFMGAVFKPAAQPGEFSVSLGGKEQLFEQTGKTLHSASSS